jgi:putative ABC transport system permease protein
LLGVILVRARAGADPGPALHRVARTFPGMQVSGRASIASADDVDRATNRWLGPLFVAIVFAFTSIAVANTLVMIALRRGRELALLRLTGATNRQVRSMARWEAAIIIAIGLGVGLAIAATALVPFTHSLTGGFTPHVPPRSLAFILGASTIVAVVSLAVPTRRALRARPIAAIGGAE